MRILVTGSRGFIGSWLAPELTAAGHDVTGVDIADGPGNDLRWSENAHRVVNEHRPDVVVHLAAQVGRLFGEDDLGHSIEANATMTARVAQACADYGARLVYCSTSEVYGDQAETECYEGGREVTPHGIYGLSKRFGEECARLYCPEGLQIIRLSMPYGPGLPAGRGRAALVNFLWHASRNEPITVHRGSKRAWCWVGDTVRGFRLVIEEGEQAQDAHDSEMGAGIYNIGRDDNETSMSRVARMACDIVGASDDLIQKVDAPGRQTVVKRLSSKKLRALGWTPEVELAEGLARTWDVVKTYDEHGMPQAVVGH